ncbi:MAG TPA: hypothetical protein VGH95_08255 [Candidatus Aquirickettsiella sp.]
MKWFLAWKTLWAKQDNKLLRFLWYAQNPNQNPWCIDRPATSEEIALENPTSCDSTEDCSELICKDPKTEATYQQVGYKVDGSGTIFRILQRVSQKLVTIFTKNLKQNLSYLLIPLIGVNMMQDCKMKWILLKLDVVLT